MDQGRDVELLIVAPGLLTSELAQRRLDEHLTQFDTECLYVSDQVYASISDRDNPVGLSAVVRQSWLDLSELPVDGTSLFVALYEVKNPGNLGTIFRTAESFGVDGIILLGSTADPYDVASIKASMGTVFSLPVARETSTQRYADWCRERNLTVITTSARAPHSLNTAPWEFPAVILFGSEAQGLPEDLLEQGTLQVRIPMSGQATSLNLAVAAGIIIYTAARNRV
jgi:TrmH family RNA methyltransferase